MHLPSRSSPYDGINLVRFSSRKLYFDGRNDHRDSLWNLDLQAEFYCFDAVAERLYRDREHVRCDLLLYGSRLRLSVLARRASDRHSF